MHYGDPTSVHFSHNYKADDMSNEKPKDHGLEVSTIGITY